MEGGLRGRFDPIGTSGLPFRGAASPHTPTTGPTTLEGFSAADGRTRAQDLDSTIEIILRVWWQGTPTVIAMQAPRCHNRPETSSTVK